MAWGTGDGRQGDRGCDVGDRAQRIGDSRHGMRDCLLDPRSLGTLMIHMLFIKPRSGSCNSALGIPGLVILVGVDISHNLWPCCLQILPLPSASAPTILDVFLGLLVMAVASLLPGTLPLGLGRLDPPGFGLKAYRWRKFGFPLKVFREVWCDIGGRGKPSISLNLRKLKIVTLFLAATKVVNREDSFR